MQRKTFERALHTWPDWDDSVEKSRSLLGYDPKWPKDKCLDWIEANNIPLKKQIESEFRRLDLPPVLGQYWADCFYSDYLDENGKYKLRKITSFLSNQKSEPHLPCDQRIVWYEDEDTHDPWIRVEIMLHARFATKELMNYAARFAYESVESNLWSEEVAPHPVCQWLKGGRPPSDEQLALECVHLKDDLNRTYAQIGSYKNWPLQRDSYGKLNQCSTASYYVKMGRELRKNTNKKPSR